MKSSLEYKKSITNKIKLAKFQEALDELEEFIEQIDDKQLSVQVLVLHARFNTEFKKYLNGLTSDTEEQNKIIYALTHLLKESEELAKEKVINKDSTKLSKKNLEILDRYAGVYENYYLNDVGNQNFISRNIYKFYKDNSP